MPLLLLQLQELQGPLGLLYVQLQLTLRLHQLLLCEVQLIFSVYQLLSGSLFLQLFFRIEQIHALLLRGSQRESLRGVVAARESVLCGGGQPQ